MHKRHFLSDYGYGYGYVCVTAHRILAHSARRFFNVMLLPAAECTRMESETYYSKWCYGAL
jgi:hypothetical protein